MHYSRSFILLQTHLEDEKGSGGPLLEELQKVWHHHLGTVGPIALLGGAQVGLLLVASPGLEEAHGLVHWEGHGEETLLFLAVKHVPDFLELEREDALFILILWGRRKDGTSTGV